MDDPKLCEFQSVLLSEGVGKYVQIEVRNAATGAERILIRHDTESDFHIQVADATLREAHFRGADATVLGGGRISVTGLDGDAPVVKIYGYSVQYGRADHEITQGFIENAYPKAEVTWTNDGY
jgi:phosphohistidine phosphatase